MLRACTLWIALAAIGLAAPIPAADEPYSFKRVFRVSETDRYNTVITFEDNGTEAVIVTTEVTREVKPDGTALVATTVDSIVLRARGSEIPFPGGTGQVVLTSYDRAGKLLKQESRGGQGNVGQLLNVARPSLYVERAMKVGETLREEVPLGTDKTRKAVVNITLIALDKKGTDIPVDCLRYKMVTDSVVAGPSGDQKTRTEVVLRVALDDGKLVSAEGKMDGIPLPTGGSSKLTYKVTRNMAKAAG